MIDIKGKGAVGIAVAYYGLRGIVSIPLEPCSYNLLFDDGKIHRVKVISCSYKSPCGVYSASVRVMGGNIPNQTYKEFDPKSCDLVFIVTADLDMYSIPSKEIKAKRQISLRVYRQYSVKFIPD